MADPVDPLDFFRDSLVDAGGGFLRNPLPEHPATCLLCTGIPGPGYPTCFNCSSFLATPYLPNRIGFLTYAVEGRQAGHVMRTYKTPAAQRHGIAKNVVLLLLANAVFRHWPCLVDPTHGPPTSWTVVPSLRHPVAHPLAQIAGSLIHETQMRHHVLAAARLAPDGRPRTFDPTWFTSPTRPTGHVLLIEDTWTTGCNVQSAAAALQRDGASHVTTLVLARWLRLSWSVTRDFVQRELTQDYSPDRCPFRSRDCPQGTVSRAGS